MCVCLCTGTNKVHTHSHTHTRECDKGSVVGLSTGVEIRSCGNGAGGVAVGVGAGGRVLGLGETGGCSSARYGVTTSKIPSSPDFITNGSLYARELAVKGELQHCNT